MEATVNRNVSENMKILSSIIRVGIYFQIDNNISEERESIQMLYQPTC